MERDKIVFAVTFFLAFALGTVVARPNEPPQSYVYVDIEKNTTLPCLAYDEVMKMNETYVFVNWYLKSYNGIDSSWKWFAGMNKFGKTKAQKGFKISKVDGSLYIDKARPCDVREFLCKVERTNGRSPKTHLVTLRLRENGNKTEASAQKEDNPQECKCKERDLHHHPHTQTVLTAIIAFLVITVLAEGCYIAYLKSSRLRAFFRPVIHRVETQAPD